MAVGRPGASAILHRTHRSLSGWTVTGGCRNAVVHRRPEQRLHPDGGWTGVCGGARIRGIQIEKRCSQRYLDPICRPGAGGADVDDPVGPASQRHAIHQLAAGSLRPVLDRPIRRAGRGTGPAAHRDPRALPRVPQPERSRRQRVHTRSARSAGRADRIGPPARGNLRRSRGGRPRTAAHPDRGQVATRISGALRGGSGTGRAGGARPDVGRHLDGSRRSRASAGPAGRVGAERRPQPAGVRRHRPGRRAAADAGRDAGPVRRDRRVDGARPGLDHAGHR